MAENKHPAVKKREKISRAQQYTMLEVLGASLVLGTCMVLSLFLIKYIKFNATVIGEKNQAIMDYDQTIRNVGICVDSDRNGRLNNEELELCNPTTTSLARVKDTLRYNILETMAKNEDLETVARQRNENCYDAGGQRIDFNKLYEASTDTAEKQQYLQLSKICSALRVIPDALPAQKNTEALMASLNQIFIVTGWEPERLSPTDDTVDVEIEGVEAIPINLRVEGSDSTVLAVLNNIERSIREFDIISATVEWTETGLSLNVTANAFYMAEQQEIETIKTVKASTKTGSKKK